MADLALLLELVESEHHLEQVAVGVVVAVLLGETPAQVGRDGVDGVGVCIRRELAEVEPPPGQERGHAGSLSDGGRLGVELGSRGSLCTTVSADTARVRTT